MNHQAPNRLRTAWANLPLQSKGIVVIAIPLAALLAGLVCFYLVGQAENRQEEWVSHTLEVRSELHQLLIHVVDAETGMRGYVLTRRDEFLDSYDAGRKALPESVSRISDLIQDDPLQVARFRKVQLLVAERMEKFDRTMEAAAEDEEQPSPMTTAALMEGKAVMDALRQELGLMDQEEAHLLGARVAELSRVRNWSFAAFVGSVLFGVLGGAAATRIFSKGIVVRIRFLGENIRRLSEEMPLLPSPVRNDEIGHLEQGANATSLLLAAHGQAQRQSEERLRRATDAAELGIWTWEPAGDRVRWENMWPYEILGMARTEAPITAARFAAEFVHPEDLAAFEQAIGETVRNGARFFYQGRFRRPDGGQRWVEFTGRPEQGLDGTCLRVLGTIQDITARK